MLKRIRPLLSKMPALAGIITILAALGIGTYIRGNLTDAWELLHIPSSKPLFMDTVFITYAIDCVFAGQDPYIVGSFDPWGRLFNYPPIWLDLRYLGVNSHSTNLIGTTLALMTAITCTFLFRARTWLSALIIFLAITSRSVLFALERGNTDELIFFLLVFGFFLIDQQRPALKSPLITLLIAILTVLKVYPVVVSVIFIGRRNGVIKTLLAVTASVVALLLTSGHRLPTLLSATPQDSAMAFGAYPFFLAITGRSSLVSTLTFLNHPRAASIGALIIGVLSIVAGYVYKDRVDRFLPKLDFDHVRGQLAISGLAIFCSAFVAGASYNYRLIFLLGMLAFLVEDMSSRMSRRSLWTAIFFLALMDRRFSLHFYQQVIDGLLFIVSSAWLGTSLAHQVIGNAHPHFGQQEVLEPK